MDAARQEIARATAAAQQAQQQADAAIQQLATVCLTHFTAASLHSACLPVLSCFATVPGLAL